MHLCVASTLNMSHGTHACFSFFYSPLSCRLILCTSESLGSASSRRLFSPETHKSVRACARAALPERLPRFSGPQDNRCTRRVDRHASRHSEGSSACRKNLVSEVVLRCVQLFSPAFFFFFTSLPPFLMLFIILQFFLFF